MREHIHVIGDSHSKGFMGPGFTAHELVWATAYNMINENSQMKGRQKAFEVLSKIEKDEYIMFSLGEIDCRAHLWKHVTEETNIQQVVEICVNRYIQFLLEVKEIGYKNIIVYGPIASNLELSDTVDYQLDTSLPLRNYGAFVFNEYLEQMCNEHGLIFITTFMNVVNEDFTTDSRLYDNTKVHLLPEVQTKYFIQQLAYYYMFKHKTE